MLTCIKGLVTFVRTLCDSDNDDESSFSNLQERPLLNIDSSFESFGSMSTVPRVKAKYGKKKTQASSRVAAIFGSAGEREPLTDLTRTLNHLQISLSPQEELISPPCHPSKNGHGTQETNSSSGDESAFSPLDDVSDASPKTGIVRRVLQNKIHEAEGDSKESNCTRYEETSETSLEPLQPLFDAFLSDHGTMPEILCWAEVLGENDANIKLTKIAEASFAEVYRITTGEESSIIKVVRIKVPADPASMECSNASTAAEILSEIRIMNELTEIPGFVSFKNAIIVQGHATQALVNAYSSYRAKHDGYSDHPDPTTYIHESKFLVIELGDAGDVLEDFNIYDINQVWDVLIGVVMALSRAELRFEFEHRDLHENNICYFISPPYPEAANTTGPRKFGRSGVSITLIDYGLSRARLKNDEVVSYDLEKDLTIFQQTGTGLQYETYRRMRTYLLTGSRTHKTSSWHVPQDPTTQGGVLHSWDDCMPYTNVLWIRYLISWLRQNYRVHGNRDDLKQFNKETTELDLRLRPQTSLTKGGFSTVVEILDYMMKEGWVTNDQVESYGFDASMLSIS